MKHGYLTNALVKIRGRQAPRVDGRPLKLSGHGHALVLLLAARAVAFPGDYFTSDELVLALERGQRVLGGLELSWARPTPANLYTAVKDARHALTRWKLSKSLIEHVLGKGYRLSTPAMNVVIDVPGAELLAKLPPPPHGRW